MNPESFEDRFGYFDETPTAGEVNSFIEKYPFEAAQCFMEFAMEKKCWWFSHSAHNYYSRTDSTKCFNLDSNHHKLMIGAVYKKFCQDMTIKQFDLLNYVILTLRSDLVYKFKCLGDCMNVLKNMKSLFIREVNRRNEIEDFIYQYIREMFSRINLFDGNEFRYHIHTILNQAEFDNMIKKFDGSIFFVGNDGDDEDDEYQEESYEVSTIP